jgi:hypothetical protein
MNDKGKGGWFYNTPVDTDVERKKKGYAVLEDKTVDCADCGESLLEVIKVQDSEEMKVVDALCPFCGGSSFLYEVKGKTYIQAFEGLAIQDMPMDFLEDGTIRVTVEVVK